MYPRLLEVGPFAIHSYGLMIALAFVVVVILIQRDALKTGIPPKVMSDAVFWSLALGIVGARLLYIIRFPQFFSWRDPLGWIAIWRGGLVFQGGPPVVIVFLYFFFRHHKLNPWQAGDVAMPYLALGHAFGRAGCFLNGCCYGVRTEAPWGIAFPRVPPDLGQRATGSPPYLDHVEHGGLEPSALWSYPVHPTQLYELAVLLALFALLMALRKHWHPFHGFTVPLYLALYSFYRFFAEFLRGDHNPTMIGALTDQQVFSLVGIAVAVPLYLWLARRAPHKARQ